MRHQGLHECLRQRLGGGFGGLRTGPLQTLDRGHCSGLL